MDSGLAREVEELGDLGGHRGHDRGVEECVETGEEERTDYDGDKDLYAAVDVTFSTGVSDCGLCGNCDGIDLVGDGVKELFHRIITSLSFCVFYLVLSLFLDFVFSLTTAVQLLINQHN